jgi:hypothetical protein|nr:MAG TPA: hypothetical protein [Caudoviricetes sp.]
MVDICKCANAKECSKKDTCFRHLAEDSIMQSYCTFYKLHRDICPYYMPVKDEEQLKELNNRWRE